MPGTTRTDYIKDGQTNIVLNTITVSQYPDTLDELSASSEVVSVLEKHTLKTDIDSRISGGSGVVYRCADGSVLKITSFRRSYTGDTNQTKSYFNITKTPNTEEEKKLRRFLLLFLKSEARTNEMLTDEEKKALVKPFIIAVSEEDVIRDYLLCVNMPYYENIKTHIGNSYNEREVLIMIKDVLEQLERAHNDGIRHRDIKPSNIMYKNAEKSAYVLIDWGASCREGDNDFAKAYYDAGLNGDSYTPLFIDPARINTPNNFNAETDLYSLGVIMAYFAHKEGYFAEGGHSVEQFCNKVCPEAMTDGIKIIASDIYRSLDNASAGYKELVRKSMDHSCEGHYEMASRMLYDVRILLGEETAPQNEPSEESKEQGETSKKSGTMTLNLWHTLYMAAMLLIPSFVLSGAYGLKTTIIDPGSTPAFVLLLVLCSLLPVFIISESVRKGTTTRWEAPVKKSYFMLGTVAYLLTCTGTDLLLNTLDETVSFDMNAISICAIYFITVLINKIPALNKAYTKSNTTKIFMYAAVVGVCMCINTILCICSSSQTDISPVVAAKLVFSIILLCLLCGVAVSYLYWLRYTNAAGTEEEIL